MTNNLPNRQEIENLIRTKLIELIELSTEHGIRIEMLMEQALHIADPESG